MALTRAKHGLVIIGDEESLRSNENWAKVIKMIKDEGVFVQGIDNALNHIKLMKIMTNEEMKLENTWEM